MALTTLDIPEKIKKQVKESGLTLTGVFMRGYNRIFTENPSSLEKQLQRNEEKMAMMQRIINRLLLRVQELEEKVKK